MRVLRATPTLASIGCSRSNAGEGRILQVQTKDASEKHGAGPGDETIRLDGCPEVEVVDAPIVQQPVTIEGIVYFDALVGTEVFSAFGLFLDYSQPLLESGRADELARSLDDAGPRFDAGLLDLVDSRLFAWKLRENDLQAEVELIEEGHAIFLNAANMKHWL